MICTTMENDLLGTVDGELQSELNILNLSAYLSTAAVHIIWDVCVSAYSLQGFSWLMELNNYYGFVIVLNIILVLCIFKSEQNCNR